MVQPRVDDVSELLISFEMLVEILDWGYSNLDVFSLVEVRFRFFFSLFEIDFESS